MGGHYRHSQADAGSLKTNARTPKYLQTDFNLGHSFGISKTNEAMRMAFEFTVLNLFNQHSVLAIQEDPLAGGTSTTSIKPKTATGDVDWVSLTTGWDPIKAANGTACTSGPTCVIGKGATTPTAYGITTKQVVANRYLQPFLFQNARTMRLAVRFVF